MTSTAPASGTAAATLPIMDHEALRAALRDANLPTLLMVYTGYVQDRAYLDSFAPYLTALYAADAPTAIPQEKADDLRDRLFALLTNPVPPVVRPIDPELLRHMMGVSVGETVDPALVPVLHDQMGFAKAVRRLDIPGRPVPPADMEVLVIGGGMSGIAAGLKLAEAGYSYTIVEKNADLGGTWFENRYPGVGVDTPSHFYSYSFELNPEWSHYHPKGAEIQAYLTGVADKYGVRSNVIFNTRVTGAVWDEAAAKWHVKLQAADGTVSEKVVSAVLLAHGVLNRWKFPAIPGIESFAGPKMHTAGWDTSVDLKGKKVAVIGTGASAAQLVPAIADEVAELTVFQRSKHWVLNNPDINIGVNDNVRFALRMIPTYKEWFRFRVYWFTGDGLYGNVLMEENWAGDPASISAQNDGARQYALNYIRTKLARRPDLIEQMTPDYPIFGKRIVLDANGGWLDTLLKPNVHLESRGIDHIESDAVVLKDGTRIEADVLALATGFEITKVVGSLDIVGRGGCRIQEDWGEDDPRSYLGVMAPGYPNFFFVLGPNSAPNHAAGVNMVLETQVNWMIETLDLMVAEKARQVEPTAAAYERWNAEVERQMKQMIWSHPKAKSYYLNSAGRNVISCPFRLADYWNWTRHPDREALTLS
ncbi:MAG: NAD(P)-binding domain-containing protein [Sphingomonadales bacterium]|nr:NAD(P)-binding domain-containing protein [Sphingomonadales bacterium]